MRDDDYSATVFNKKHIASPENLLQRVILLPNEGCFNLFRFA